MYIDQKFYDSDIRRYDNARWFVYKVFSDDALKNEFANYISNKIGCNITSIEKFCITFDYRNRDRIDLVQAIKEAYDRVYKMYSGDVDPIINGASIYTMIKYMQDSISIMPL